MAATNFLDEITVIEPEWLNEVNAIVHDVFNGASTTSAARTAIGLGTDDTPEFNGIDVDGGRITLDEDADTYLEISEDTIDIYVNGSLDWTIDANNLRGAVGSILRVNDIVERSTDHGVEIESVTLKDGNVEIASGNGIDFSATSDASGMASELLDDYEEGTWTPFIADDSLSDSEGQTYDTSIQHGYYTKIGNLVHVDGYMNVSSLGTLTGSHSAKIGGLPYTASSATNYRSSGAVGFMAHAAATAGFTTACLVQPGDSYATIYWSDQTTGTSAMTLTEFGTGTIEFSFTYRV